MQNTVEEKVDDSKKKKNNSIIYMTYKIVQLRFFIGLFELKKVKFAKRKKK